MSLPRGIRNNNPGNIIRNANRWKGLSADQSTDNRFCVFNAPEWGIRAMVRILQTYCELYSINTVRGLINRWAPPTENNTDAYVHAVATRLGVRTDELIDVCNHDVMIQLIQAITAHENGTGYGEYYDTATLDKGLTLAGINS